MNFLESMLAGFEIIGLALILSIVKAKMESSLGWFIICSGVLLGLGIYLLGL